MSLLTFEALPSFIISLSGVVVGFLSIYMIYSSMKTLGGKVGNAFWYIMWGVFMQTLGFAYVLSVSLGFTPPFPDNLYRAIISSGLVFILLGARTFSELSR